MTTIQAHMIHDSDGQLSRVTVNDDDAQMAQAEGKCVTTNATAEEIFDAFMPTLPLRLMDDAAWQHLAPPWLKSEADQIAKKYREPPQRRRIPVPARNHAFQPASSRPARAPPV